MALQRFYNATDKLVNAFIMGSIRHGSDCSCAVGTLCDGNNLWFKYGHWGLEQEDVLNVIKQTQYTPHEIYEIERYFEGRRISFLIGRKSKDEHIDFGTLHNDNDSDGFKGLCNVFDYMISIEDWSEEESQVNIFELLQSVN